MTGLSKHRQARMRERADHDRRRNEKILNAMPNGSELAEALQAAARAGRAQMVSDDREPEGVAPLYVTMAIGLMIDADVRRALFRSAFKAVPPTVGDAPGTLWEEPVDLTTRTISDG